MAGKQRIDVLLVERGLAASRDRAQRLILAGKVLVADRVVDKAGTKVPDDAEVRLRGVDHPYVSRGGLKLEGALDDLELDPAGLRCLDLGASTGGFTDCLLQRGAAKVYAVDTGYGALAWTMRQHERVEVMERTNVLHCDVPEAVDLVVIDVGWTPQVKVIPVAAKWVRPGGRIVSLLKPTFEYDKQHPNQRRDKRVPLTAEQTQAVIDGVYAGLEKIGFTPTQIVESVLLGKGGNHEYLLEFVL